MVDTPANAETVTESAAALATEGVGTATEVASMTVDEGTTIGAPLLESVTTTEGLWRAVYGVHNY